MLHAAFRIARRELVRPSATLWAVAGVAALNAGGCTAVAGPAGCASGVTAGGVAGAAQPDAASPAEARTTSATASDAATALPARPPAASAAAVPT